MADVRHLLAEALSGLRQAEDQREAEGWNDRVGQEVTEAVRRVRWAIDEMDAQDAWEATDA